MRGVVTDIIAALAGIAFAGLVLHNPKATADVVSGGLGSYASALNVAGSTS